LGVRVLPPELVTEKIGRRNKLKIKKNEKNKRENCKKGKSEKKKKIIVVIRKR
jgi:hypothetical protein